MGESNSYPNSSNKVLYHAAWFAASARLIYSASVVDWATVFCFLVPHEMAALPSKKHNPKWSACLLDLPKKSPHSHKGLHHFSLHHTESCSPWLYANRIGHILPGGYVVGKGWKRIG